MKRLIAFLELLVLISILCINAFAVGITSNSNSKVDISVNALSESLFIAESMMVAIDGEANKFDNFSALYDFNRNLTAYCFNFNPCGYVIVNIGDYSISAMSAINQTPYPQLNGDEGYVYVYSNLTNFYTLTDNGVLTSIHTGETCNISGIEFESNINYDKAAREEQMLAFLHRGDATIRTTNDIVEMTAHLPEGFQNGSYTCGLNALAIELRYLFDYHYLNRPSDMVLTNNGYIQGYLSDNDYINNDTVNGLNGYHIVHGSFLQLSYKGINQFFEDSQNSIRADDKSFTNNNVSLMRLSFIDDIPVMLGTTGNMEVVPGGITKAHWYVAYGYQNISGNEFFVTNDGYGNNGVILPVSTAYYDEIILFE